MQTEFKAGAVVYAKDIARVSQFYSHVVGLPITLRETEFVVLQSLTFQLVVVAVPSEIAAQITIETPPVRREDTAVKLCFSVSSIEAAREEAAMWGGQLNGSEREWEFQGSHVCDGHDPEGNVIQVRARVP